MTAAARWITIGFLSCMATVGWSSVALGEGPWSLGVPSLSGSSSSSLSGGALVVPGVQSLDGGQQAQAQVQVSLTNPEVVAEREASRSKFEGLNGEQAKRVAGESFAAAIDEPAGGPPKLPVGEKILGFAGSSVAQVDLGAQGEGVVESTVPMALATSSGGWAPVDLGLRETGGVFEAANPLVDVRLPKHLGGGAQLSPVGLSVTPVDSLGAPLSGSEGVVDGASVFFANTQLDSDTLMKPSSRGLDVSTVLRSVESAQSLYYSVGLPQGASLMPASDGSRTVEVVKEGVTIAIIPAPAAQDAAGTSVPVSMSVSGSTIVLTVNHRSGSFKYPILVDPEFWEEWENIVPANWNFQEWVGYNYGKRGEELWMQHPGLPSQEGDYGNWAEWTKGYTKIYQVYIKDNLYPTYERVLFEYKESTPSFLIAGIEIFSEGWKEGHGEKHFTPLTGSPYNKEATVCANTNCSPESIADHNGAAFNITTGHVSSEEAEKYHEFGGTATQISTAIAEEKGRHSTVKYNTSLSEVEIEPSVKTSNVFYGGGAWIGPHSGGFEFIGEDGGLGVSETKVEYKGSGGWESRGGKSYLTSPGCRGIQCETTQQEIYSYNSLTGNGTKSLTEPETHIRVAAKSYMPYTTSSEYGEGEAVLKVDSKKPHGITLSGLASKGEGLELGEVEAHVKVEATDGEGGPSSGIRELELGINGKKIGTVGGSCSPGTCTASNEWAINGAELGAGVFTLTAVATDNAGNKEVKEYSLTIHHASPIAMGSGSVNPESGDFAMQATDVDLSGGMGSLSLTRHYDSRNLEEGAEGPLGPQWTIGLGSLANLEVLPDGSVMIIGSKGLTHFSVKKGGGFEAPPGDANLKLEYESKKPAYILKNEAQKATTEFTLPKGTKTWMPTISQGAVATDTMTDEYVSVETESKKMIIEPTMELAPHPSATCAKEKMEAGCRALEFKYGKETTAKGEAKSEWGEYKNRLKEVVAVAYNPPTKKVISTPVAQYEYDKKGRLRAEWDPRISPALKTLYGYDEEGHVTAVNGPGLQPWLLRYGTIPGDVSAGRLLSVIRPSASTALGSGQVPSNTVAPTLSSTSPTVGVKISLSSNGTWGGSPLSYTYQWEDCVFGRSGCTPIPGAVNQSYYPVKSDEGRTLIAVVGAVNATGTVTAVSSTSPSIVLPGTPYSPAPEPPSVGSNSVWSIEYQVPLSGSELHTMTKAEVEKWGQTDNPVEVAAVFPPDEPMGWPAKDYKRATVYYMDNEAHTVNVAAPSGAVSTTEYNQTNNVVERSLTPDNRAAALKEGSKSVEVSKLLDTKSVYSSDGTQLLETRGPQHTVKLSSGSEVQARNKVKYFYDENAPGGEMFDLVTRITDSAEYEGKEADVRETKTSYSGQSNLGWRLRKPTSVTTDPAGLNLTKTVMYEESTGNVIETKTPGSHPSPSYTSQFGSGGAGAGQFNGPKGIVLDGKGNVVVADEGNARVDVFRENGEFVKMFGSYGTGGGQFLEVKGVAVDSKGNFWTVDQGNNRIGEFNEKGEYQKTIGTAGTGAGQFKEPKGIAVDAHNNVWVTDFGNNRIARFNEKGEPVATYGFGVSNGEEKLEACASGCRAGNPGSGNGQLERPRELATDSTGNVWVTDTGNNRVEEFNEKGEFVRVFGSAGIGNGQFKEPKGISVAAGNVWVTDAENNRVEEFNEKGEFEAKFGSEGTGSGQFHEPWDIQLNARGEVFVSDTSNNRIEKFAPAGTEVPQPPSYSSKFGSYGSGSGQFSSPKGIVLDGKGNVIVADEGNARVDVLKENGEFVKSFGTYGTGAGQFLEVKGVAVDSKSDVWVLDQGNNRVEEVNEKYEYTKTIGAVGAGAGQLKEPKGIAIDTHNNIWIADTGNNRLEKFNEKGEFVATYGFGVSNGEEKFETCTSGCRAGNPGSGQGQLERPRELATDSTGNIWVTDTGNNRVEEFNEKGEFAKVFGSTGTGNGQFKEPKGITVDTNRNVWVTDAENNRVEEFNEKGEYVTQFGSEGTENGQFHEPWGIQLNTHEEVVISDAINNRIEKFTLPRKPGNPEAHNTQTVYYSAIANPTHPNCGSHPEWANLPCQTQPAVQPETSGLPNLPVTSIIYNIWDQVETSTETFGSTTRIRKNTFDSAGRPLTSEDTSTAGKAFPKVTDEYNTATGALEKQSTTTEGKTKTITSTTNTLGQLSSYTDADSNTTTYKYDVDGRAEEVSDIKGSQIYAYDPTTGFLTKLLDSGAGTFTASYDAEGKMLTEGYPNGMNATYTISPAGQDTKVEYIKTTHCTTGCTWFSDSVVPSIHGETLSQTSTLSSEIYAYDNAGRLTQTQETPAGKGCTTRLYTYDEESNRTALTTREPGSKGECATTGGTTEKHTYDTANRLIDTAISYEALGNTANLPASDAGSNELTSTYYVDSQVASQTQNGETMNYGYDPATRTRETISSGKTASTVISHYDGPGNALSWTSESTEKWTRNIPGIGGKVAAIQANAGTPVLQLHDLHGNIIATAALSETETKLLSTYNSTEFGVPTTSNPPKYSWLGADGVASELPSGDIAQDGSTYIPITGLPLQTQPVELPLPINAVKPVSDAEPQWLAEQAGLSSAEEVTAAHEAEKANNPTSVEVDPIHEYLLTPEEAIEYGEVLCNCAVVGPVAEVVEEIFGPVGADVAKALLGNGALQVLGEQLVECGKNTNSNSRNRCRITLHTRGLWTPLGTFDTWIPSSIYVDTCYYYKKSFNGLKRGLNCPGKYYG